MHINSSGTTIEIYKDKGLPANVLNRFDVKNFTGTHALGHTRMATESAVTIQHSHPFSTGQDLCLVHNGSLSNHNRLREKLQKKGIIFRTDNDSEVAAGYLMQRMRQGDSLDRPVPRRTWLVLHKLRTGPEVARRRTKEQTACPPRPLQAIC